MYSLSDIQRLHIELSSLCNARCPSCVRNIHGAIVNTGYTERNLSLADVKKIFPTSVAAQIQNILLCGNFGDMLMNPETSDIIDWFKSHSPGVKVSGNTNGGGGSKEFWHRLGTQGVEITFALDGLADTHSLYRQNTLFSTVIKNAQIFIAAGGRAVWQMIHFNHNRHQVDACRQMSQDLGFAEFFLRPNERGHTPAFNADGSYSHSINGSPRLNLDTTEYRKKKEYILTQRWANKQESQFHQEMTINCQAQRIKELYVNSLGEIYPCCFVGHNPQTLDPTMNENMIQLKELFKNGENNAIDRPLEDCIQWFNNIVNTWQYTTVATGALSVCQNSCGTPCK
jgi:MoaA/NifB/PqqE/SkfB family radical SAM enzyme